MTALKKFQDSPKDFGNIHLSEVHPTSGQFHYLQDNCKSFSVNFKVALKTSGQFHEYQENCGNFREALRSLGKC